MHDIPEREAPLLLEFDLARRQAVIEILQPDRRTPDICRQHGIGIPLRLPVRQVHQPEILPHDQLVQTEGEMPGDGGNLALPLL